MVEFTKLNYLEIMTGDPIRFSCLNNPTFHSILDDNLIIWRKIEQSQNIYSSCQILYATRIPDRIKEKLEKHLRFAEMCNKFYGDVWTNILSIKYFEQCVINNILIHNSNIEQKRRNVENDVKRFYQRTTKPVNLTGFNFEM